MTCSHDFATRARALNEDHCPVCLLAERDSLKAQKDSAYAERNQCVALIARMALALGWRVSVGRHPDLDVDWENDWRTLLFVDLPTGQATWHFHDSERHLLEGLPEAQQKWDGHDTPEKYRRVNTALAAPTDTTSAKPPELRYGVMEKEVDHG